MRARCALSAEIYEGKTNKGRRAREGGRRKQGGRRASKRQLATRSTGTVKRPQVSAKRESRQKPSMKKEKSITAGAGVT